MHIPKPSTRSLEGLWKRQERHLPPGECRLVSAVFSSHFSLQNSPQILTPDSQILSIIKSSNEAMRRKQSTHKQQLMHIPKPSTRSLEGLWKRQEGHLPPGECRLVSGCFSLHLSLHFSLQNSAQTLTSDSQILSIIKSSNEAMSRKQSTPQAAVHTHS
jgi:hypothetical protein